VRLVLELDGVLARLDGRIHGNVQRAVKAQLADDSGDDDGSNRQQ
jgi:hypothetical protein